MLDEQVTLMRGEIEVLKKIQNERYVTGFNNISIN